MRKVLLRPVDGGVDSTPKQLVWRTGWCCPRACRALRPRAQELWLKSNRLTSLPEELGDCAKLKRLWLDDNRLTTLPDSLTRLSALQELYAPHNRLTALPPALARLPALRKLCVAAPFHPPRPQHCEGLARG
jgi:hypothetical protein